MRSAAAVLLGAALLAVSGCGTGRDGSTGPQAPATHLRGSVAYTVRDDAGSRIWLLDLKTGKRRPLLRKSMPTLGHAYLEASPAWSADGRTVFFSAAVGRRSVPLADRSELFKADVATGRIRRITRNRHADVMPEPAPDGARVAFAASAGDAHGLSIYVMRSDGTATRRLTDPQGDDANPTWSPDGHTIFFERTGDDGSQSSRLMSVMATGGPQQEVEGPPSFGPAVSRTDQVAFTTGRDGNGELCFEECVPAQEIYVRTTDGSSRRQTHTSQSEESPSWTPDGKIIVHVRRSDDAPAGSIYALDPSAGCSRRLLRATTTWLSEAAVSPRATIRLMC